MVVAAFLALTGCGSATTAPGSAATSARAGDTATWQLGSAPEPSEDGASVDLLVTRLGCAGGETGTVLDPVITVEEDRVVISTPVEPLSGEEDCPGNDAVPHQVELGPDALGKDLVDAACLEGAEAVGTAACSPGPARWHLPTLDHSDSIDWTSPEAYTFQVSSLCGERAFLGTVQIEVTQGKVTAAEQLGDRFADVAPEAAMTMEDIVAEANSGGGVRRVQLDADGTPRYVSMGEDLAQSDAAACYFIHAFSVEGS